MRTYYRLGEPETRGEVIRVGIAEDHAGFALKKQLTMALRELGHEVVDLGSSSLTPEDDCPDYVVPLARNAWRGGARGGAICGSGVGACVTANKVKGAGAALVHDIFSARLGVEDDDMNVICFGGARARSRARFGFDRSLLDRSFQWCGTSPTPLGKVAALESEKSTGDKKQCR